MAPNRMVALRKRLGWSQTRLAQSLGMTLSAVWRMENGKRPIRTVTALAVEHLVLLHAS